MAPRPPEDDSWHADEVDKWDARTIAQKKLGREIVELVTRTPRPTAPHRKFDERMKEFNKRLEDIHTRHTGSSRSSSSSSVFENKKGRSVTVSVDYETNKLWGIIKMAGKSLPIIPLIIFGVIGYNLLFGDDNDDIKEETKDIYNTIEEVVKETITDEG